MQYIILHLGSEVTPTEDGSETPNTFKQRLDVLSYTEKKTFNISWCYCHVQPNLAPVFSLCTTC